MVEAVALATFTAALVASAVMAWVIGAGSSGATPFAPAVGANTISVMRAELVVGILVAVGGSEAAGRTKLARTVAA